MLPHQDRARSIRRVHFDTNVVGTTSAARTVTLTNRRNVVLNLNSIAASAGFAVPINTCGASVAAGTSCIVGVTFSPTTIGSIAGTLTFTDDAPGNPQTVSLSGTGAAP